MQFTALASGNLATVELGLTYGDNGPALVNVFLYANLAGSPTDSPDTASQIFLGTATPTVMFGTTNNSLVTVNIAGNVPVTLGTPYWLALMPIVSNVDVWNRTSPAVPGLVATSVDNGQTWFPTPDVLAAFRITAAVPEPSSWAAGLLTTGAILCSVWRRRKFLPRT